MKSGWITKRLADVCEKITDGTHQTPTYFDKGFIFLSSRNVTNEKIDWEKIKYIDSKQHHEMQKRVTPRMNDILLAKNGTTGVAAMVDRDETFDIYVSLALLRARKEILPDFLLRFVNSPKAKEQFNKRLKGIGVPNLHLEEIREVLISFPESFKEQKRIVGILDEVFERISAAKAAAEMNLQNARALFESYLDNVFSGHSDGWVEKKLGDVLQKTETINPNLNPQKEFIYIDVSSVSNKSLKVENPTTLKGKDAPSRARKLIKTGDVIFATVRPTLRRISIIKSEFNNQVCSTGYFVLRANTEINNSLIFYYLLTSSFLENMEKLQRGASYPAVTDGDVKDQIICYPKSTSEQKRIIATLDILREETQYLESVYKQKLNALEELKRSLLNQAFAGEL